MGIGQAREVVNLETNFVPYWAFIVELRISFESLESTEIQKQ